MTETLSPAVPDAVDAATHREEYFGDVGRGPLRIECPRVEREMLSEAL